VRHSRLGGAGPGSPRGRTSRMKNGCDHSDDRRNKRRDRNPKRPVQIPFGLTCARFSLQRLFPKPSLHKVKLCLASNGIASTIIVTNSLLAGSLQ
jgi:hypothetical protein